MTYSLDSNACIELLRPGRGDSIRAKIDAQPAGAVVVCSVVRMELVFGAHRSQKVAHNLLQVRNLLAAFPSLPFDDAAAEIAGEFRARLSRVGSTIGPHDVQIAAIAVAHQATIVTHNVSEFSRITELRVEDWQ